MIGMSLQFENGVVGESVGSIPTVKNIGFFVLSIGQFLPHEAVVLDIVDGLEVENGPARYEGVDHERLKSENKVYSSCKNN